MERASNSLSKLRLSDKMSGEELARAAWPSAVGKRIALRASVATLVRDRLVVEVEDAIWQKQLFHLRYQILTKLAQLIGDEIVRDIEFRIATPRRPPQPAAHIDEARRPHDDADGIKDPVLRILYKESRKKASA
jgi:predicted nucleic acid-binding Zn ribbon protein